MAGRELPRTGRFRLLGRALAKCLIAPVGLLLAFLLLPVAALTLAWVGTPLLLAVLPLVRGLAKLGRLSARRLLGVEVPRPYRPHPRGWRVAARTALGDPATWRDLCWLLVNGTVGLVLCVLSIVLFGVGVGAVGLAAAWPQLPAGALADGPPWLAVQISTFVEISPRVVCLCAGAALLLWWWLATPALIRTDARLARLLLAPTERARLMLRVEELATSRAETVDTQAAELRRIERDLHDGAQARLVALSMSLGMAHEIVDSDPQTAKALLGEARSASGQALAELRQLVRGIHPPVLADRGLEGAVRALGLGTPLPVEVEAEIPARLPPPVESAAYFAIAEVLTNVVKHAGAEKAWVRMRYDGSTLSLAVGDDGVGGADVDAGTGLRGVQRRLATFDGTLRVSSPIGGPTAVTMELPCALLSPKTSPSSETG